MRAGGFAGLGDHEGLETNISLSSGSLQEKSKKDPQKEERATAAVHLFRGGGGGKKWGKEGARLHQGAKSARGGDGKKEGKAIKGKGHDAWC